MRIVIADQMEEEVVKGISALGEVTYKPADVKGALEEADALIVRSATKVTADLISGAQRLKIVARAGVGLDNVDQAACKAKGIKVLNTPGASSNAVAELAIGLIIGAMRNIQKAHHQMKGGKWEKKTLAGNEIEGKTLGIIGYGRIGALLGNKARALGMHVIAYNPPPRHDDGMVEFVENLDAFLGRADAISLHVPATPQTVNLVCRESIAKMKDGVIIINTSRGEIIDEDALYEAAKSGKVGGAALDVFRKEPYSGKLLELDNVYLTPHLGASTKEAQEKIGAELVRLLKEELGKGL
ncbi:hydroxyacid dehydrogenase [Candidatus Micrarchaeota archaeon]|nr:hydroxyacid dehydrogenase [Candidatus Micrarchaeota archaeon]